MRSSYEAQVLLAFGRSRDIWQGPDFARACWACTPNGGHPPGLFTSAQGQDRRLSGYHSIARSSASLAAEALLSYLYDGAPRPEPQNYRMRRLSDRNREIDTHFAAEGDSIDLAKEYGVSRRRIYQVIHAFMSNATSTEIGTDVFCA